MTFLSNLVDTITP